MSIEQFQAAVTSKLLSDNNCSNTGCFTYTPCYTPGVMTRRQKLILVILGALDFVVITLLASVVLRAVRPSPAISPVAVQASPCERRLVELLSASPLFTDNAPMVAWDERQLALALRVAYATSKPPEDSAQLLWDALDIVAAVAAGECSLPETVTITVDAQGETEAQRFLAQLTGPDIEDWATGKVSDATLAAQALYRQTTTSP